MLTLQVYDVQIDRPECLTLPFIIQVTFGVMMGQGDYSSFLPSRTVKIGQEIMIAKGIRVALMFLEPIFHLFKTHRKM